MVSYIHYIIFLLHAFMMHFQLIPINASDFEIDAQKRKTGGKKEKESKIELLPSRCLGLQLETNIELGTHSTMGDMQLGVSTGCCGKIGPHKPNLQNQ